MGHLHFDIPSAGTLGSASALLAQFKSIFHKYDAIPCTSFLFSCSLPLYVLVLCIYYGCHFGPVFWEGLEINAPIIGPLGLPENAHQNNFLKWRFDPYVIFVLQILQNLLITFSMRWIWFSLPDKKLCDKIPAWLSGFIPDCLHRWAQWGCLPATFFCGIALLCNAPISMLASRSMFSLKLTLLPYSPADWLKLSQLIHSLCVLRTYKSRNSCSYTIYSINLQSWENLSEETEGKLFPKKTLIFRFWFTSES